VAWIILAIAGALEVVWASTMKASDGFSKLGPSLLTVIIAGVSFWLLSLAMRDLPLGTAYAVWVGIGALGAFCVGIWLWNEPVSAARLISAGLILVGIIGLKVSA